VLTHWQSVRCWQRGLRLGEDLALIGLGHCPQGDFSDPPLTTVHHGSLWSTGRRLAEMMLKRIQGMPVQVLQVVLQPQWALRQSDCICPVRG